MNQTDEFGEPLPPDNEQDLAVHLQRLAHAEGFSGCRAGLAGMLFGFGGALYLAECEDGNDRALLALSALAATIGALIYGARAQASRVVLGNAALTNPQALMNALETRLADVTGEFDREDLLYAAELVFYDARRALEKPLPADTSLRTIQEEMYDLVPNEEVTEMDDSAGETEDIPEAIMLPDIPEDVRIFADPAWRLDFEYGLASDIRDASDDVRLQTFRPRVVDAFVQNRSLETQVTAFYNGEAHLQPVVDEFYRHQDALVFLYKQCTLWESLPDLRWLHQEIEYAFALEVAGHQTGEGLLAKMQAERMMASMARWDYEHAHPFDGRTQEQQRVLDEMDRHVTALERFCENAASQRI